MSKKVLKYEEIDFKNINYEIPNKKGNAYFSNMYYKPNIPIHIISPKVTSLSSFDEINSSKSSLIEIEVNKKDVNFYDFFTNLDLKNVQETFNNSKNWFGKEIPLEQIDDMYKRTNKPIKDGENIKIAFKLPFYKDKLQCPVYNQNRDLIDPEQIDKGSNIILCINIKGLKILRSTYYCDIFISQIQIFQKYHKYNIFEECIFDKELSENYEDPNDLIDTEYISKLKNEKLIYHKKLKEELNQIKKKQTHYLQEIEKLNEEEIRITKEIKSQSQN